MGSPHEVSAFRFGHVLLPLDGSKFALAALPTARALSVRFRAELATISVAADERDARRLRRHAARALGESHAGGERVRVVIGNDPARSVRSRADELGSCLVCMSTRGRGRVTGAVIGSVARAVLQSSTTPMVTVGPQADRPPLLVGRPRRRPRTWPEPLSIRSLVACVDGSASSEAVLPVAAQWAQALDMRLTILTVAEDATSLSGEAARNRFGPADPAGYVEHLAAQWNDVLAGTVGRVVLDPVAVESGVRAYLSTRQAGLVCVTTRARTGLDRVRLGAVAADIIRVSTAPALVVPAGDT